MTSSTENSYEALSLFQNILDGLANGLADYPDDLRRIENLNRGISLVVSGSKITVTYYFEGPQATKEVFYKEVQDNVGGAIGTFVGGAVGSFAGPVGTVLGAAAGSYFGKDILDALLGYAQSNGRSIGNMSSARLPGAFGLAAPGYETNALDVLSDLGTFQNFPPAASSPSIEPTPEVPSLVNPTVSVEPVSLSPIAPTAPNVSAFQPVTPTTSPVPDWVDAFNKASTANSYSNISEGYSGDGSYYSGSDSQGGYAGGRGSNSSGGSSSGVGGFSRGSSGSGSYSSGRGTGFASTPAEGPTPSSRPETNWSGYDTPSEKNAGSRPDANGGVGGGGSGRGNGGGGGSKGGSGTGTAWSPVLLELDGGGLNVDSLNEANRYLDLEGNGQAYRTAWAGRGTGVLVLDADANGKITSSGEFAFTEWDRTARTDLEAIKNVFDTNHNGKLDSGDARWSEFRVEVNGDLVSLDSLGITSIDLTPTGSGQTFADGSAISGTTTFTRTDGTKGAVGDAMLMADATGCRIDEVFSLNPDGSSSRDISGYSTDGRLQFRNIVTTSADGNSITTNFDDDGNGTFDRSQTLLIAVRPDGGRIKTVSNYTVDGSLANRTSTATSLDQSIVTTTLDRNGDGAADERQVFETFGDGSTQTTTQSLSFDGTVVAEVVTTAGADGLTKDSVIDIDANGTIDEVAAETTTIGSDGTRTTTATKVSRDGSLLGSTTTEISADSRSKVVTQDVDGDGSADLSTASQTSIAADGVVTTTSVTRNRNGSVRGGVTSTRSADGLVTSTSTDLDGDQVADIYDLNQVDVGADGSRGQTIERRSSDGTLLYRAETTTSADGRTISEVVDTNGDGQADSTSSTTVAADGTTTKTENILAANGSLVSSATRTVTGDASIITTSADLDGDGTADFSSVLTRTRASDGSAIEVVSALSSDGTLLNRSTVTTSSDSLTTVRSVDLDGDGDIDQITTDQVVLHADGSRSQTVTMVSQDGTVQSSTASVVTADRKLNTVEIDSDGDGAIDVRKLTEVLADGVRRETVRSFAADGSLIDSLSAVTSASGLSSTARLDLNGDGTIDRITEDSVEISANGDRTRTVSERAGDSSLLRQKTTVTSGNGLATSTSEDIDGDGDIDLRTSNTTTLNSDGSSTTTATVYRGSGVVERIVKTVSANGLSSITEVDRDGDGDIDWRSHAVSAVTANGSSTTFEETRTAGGELLSSTTSTVTADRAEQTKSYDIDGDGSADLQEYVSVLADGATVRDTSTLRDGVVTSRVVDTASANKLSRTIRIDHDGDGVNDRVITEAVSVQANGSKVVTRSEANEAGQIVDRTTITTDADGLTETVSWQSPNGSDDRTRSSVRSLGSDGSITESVTYRGAGGHLQSSMQTVTSANGHNVTQAYDSDGDGHVDQRSIRSRGTDGSIAEVHQDVSVGGALLSSRSTATAANGLARTIDFDFDGNGVVDKRFVEAVTFANDGSTSTSIREYEPADGSLSLASESVVEKSANGLSLHTTYDLNGDGVVDKSLDDTTVLNADGSTSRTIDRYSGTSLESRDSVSTSANGLVRETEIQGTSGLTERSTDSTVLNDDGTRTRTITNTGSNLEVLSRQTVATSADGRTIDVTEDRGGTLGTRASTTSSDVLADGSVASVTARSVAGLVVDRISSFASGDGRTLVVQRDADGDGTIDQVTETVLRASGMKGSVTTNFADDGTVANRSTTTTSADSRIVTIDWDNDGNGSADRRRTQVNTAFADGGFKSVISDVEVATGKLLSKTTNIKSADGKTEVSQRDVDGDGIIDQLATRTVDASGSAKAVIENNAAARNTRHLVPGVVNWHSAIAARMESETSADGRQTVTRYDYDGDGQYEVISTASRRIDGSVITSYRETNAAGAVIATGTSTISADGEVTSLLKDEDGNGTIDLKTTSSLAIDGSRVVTADKFGSGGALLQRTEERVSAFGQMVQRSVKDGLGRLTSLLAVASDASSRQTTYDAGSGAVLTRTDMGTDGLVDTAVLYDPLHANPWSRIEQMFNAQGQKSSERHFLDNGNQVQLTMHVASGGTERADYYNAGGSRTSSIDYDVANAAAWSRVEKAYDSLGRVTSQTTVADNGSRIAYSFDAASGQKLTETAYTAGGVVSSQVLYDSLNQATWLRVERSYDAAGRATSEQQFMDDGSRALVVFEASTGKTNYIEYFGAAGWRTAVVDYDQANEVNWSRVENFYDAAGRLVRHVPFYDDGSRAVQYHDAAGSTGWSTYTEHYSVSGHLMSIYQANDNGTIYTVQYDPTNANSWGRIESYYDAYGRATSSYVFYDSGERTETAYDAANAGNWSSVTVTFSGNGTITSTRTNYDDGTGYQYEPTVPRETWYANNGNPISSISYYGDSGYVYQKVQYDIYNNEKWTKIVEQWEIAANRATLYYVYLDNGHVRIEDYSNPVVFDMNGDNNITLASLRDDQIDSSVTFDWTGDGIRDATAWVAPEDGLLVIDLAADGTAGSDGEIDQMREIAFAMWPEDAHENPVSDLEGLRIAFDSNNDNILDDKDARWAEFRVWQDLNQNGVSEDGELRTLNEAGFKLINLLPTPEGAMTFADGSKITGTSSYETVDGLTHLVADASFRFRPSEQLA